MKWLNKRKPCRARFVSGLEDGHYWRFEETHWVKHRGWYLRGFHECNNHAVTMWEV